MILIQNACFNVPVRTFGKKQKILTAESTLFVAHLFYTAKDQ